MNGDGWLAIGMALGWWLDQLGITLGSLLT